MSDRSLSSSLESELAPWVDALRAGRYPAAMEGLKLFLSAHPDHELATGMLAATYFQIGMPDHAQALFERVLQMNPQNMLARAQLAQLANGAVPGAPESKS
jgi:Tfp pilus assembly protein PilF